MRNILILLSVFLCTATNAQKYTWKTGDMDGSRVGCSAASTENIEQALGSFQKGVYVAPNGKKFGKSTAVAKVARIVLEAQPQMADVKKVIGHSVQPMPAAKNESMLSRWFVDIIMDKVSSLSGKKVDVGICNFGGIRADMPQGDIILEDILAMFPFKNSLVYLELEGRQLRDIFEKMAAGRFQAIGGVKILAENKTLTSVLVGGEPLQDDKVYGVATISFLLNGGDGLTLADGASNLQHYDIYVNEAILEHLAKLNAEGKSVIGTDERCVTIK